MADFHDLMRGHAPRPAPLDAVEKYLREKGLHDPAPPKTPTPADRVTAALGPAFARLNRDPDVTGVGMTYEARPGEAGGPPTGRVTLYVNFALTPGP